MQVRQLYGRIFSEDKRRLGYARTRTTAEASTLPEGKRNSCTGRDVDGTKTEREQEGCRRMTSPRRRNKVNYSLPRAGGLQQRSSDLEVHDDDER